MADDLPNGGVGRRPEPPLHADPEQVSAALGVRVRAALEAVQDRTSGSLEGLRSALAGVEERLAGSVAQLQSGLEDVPTSTRSMVDAAVERLRADLDAVHLLPQQIARALTIVRDAVGEIASAQEAVGERMAALAAEMEAVREAATARNEADERLATALEEIRWALTASRRRRRGLFRR